MYAIILSYLFSSSIHRTRSFSLDGDKHYWDARYQQSLEKGEIYDWYQNYATSPGSLFLHHFFLFLIPRSSRFESVH